MKATLKSAKGNMVGDHDDNSEWIILSETCDDDDNWQLADNDDVNDDDNDDDDNSDDNDDDNDSNDDDDNWRHSKEDVGQLDWLTMTGNLDNHSYDY